MRYNIGDIVVKESTVFGRQHVKVTKKTDNVNRRGLPGFEGFAVNEDGVEIRKDDPYGNKVWGYSHEVIKVIRKTS